MANFYNIEAGVTGSPTLQDPTGVPSTDTAYMQSLFTLASDTGALVVIPPGRWRITSMLTFLRNTSGNGLRVVGYGPGVSILVNETDGPLIDAAAPDGVTYYGHSFRDFSIEQPGVGGSTTSHGIRLRSYRGCDISNVWFTNLGDKGIYLDYTGVDATATSLTAISLCRFYGLGGIAVCAGNTVANGPMANLLVRNNWFDRCGQAFWGAFSSGALEFNTFAYSNKGPQVELSSTISHPFCPVIRGNNFEGGELGELWMKHTYGGTIQGNRFLATFLGETDVLPGNSPTSSYGIAFGDDTGSGFDAHTVTVEDNIVQYESLSGTLTSFTMYDLRNTAKNIKIGGTFWQGFDAGFTKVSDNNAEPFPNGMRGYSDFLGSYVSPLKAQKTHDNPATPLSPAVFDGEWHNITWTDAGAKTINMPSTPDGALNDGRELVLRIHNNTGGVITVTFGNAQTGGLYTDPANGERCICKFSYDRIIQDWVMTSYVKY